MNHNPLILSWVCVGFSLIVLKVVGPKYCMKGLDDVKTWV
jgi:hypothetical protein